MYTFYISSQHKYVAILLYLLYHTEKVRSSRSPFQEFRVRQTEDLDKVVRCKIQRFPKKRQFHFDYFFISSIQKLFLHCVPPSCMLIDPLHFRREIMGSPCIIQPGYIRSSTCRQVCRMPFLWENECTQKLVHSWSALFYMHFSVLIGQKMQCLAGIMRTM